MDNKYYNKNLSLGENVKQKIIAGGVAMKDILKNTAIEVALLATLGIVVGAYHQTWVESKRAKIPLAFSELGAVERNAKKNNIEVWPITEYELKVNDMCMKIFEAYNEAQNPFMSKTDYEEFASNIYNIMEQRNIYRYNLKDLLEQVPTYIPQMNKKLEKYRTISEGLDVANSNLANAWDESHTDNYHTEIRTRTVTDSKGNPHTETYTVQVYDNTTHTYEYDKKYGEWSAKNLNDLFVKVPTIKLEEKILKTTETNADGEYAAEKSRWIVNPKDRLTQQQLLDVANTWYTGSTILENIGTVESVYPKLYTSKWEWNIAKNTAHDDTYTTTSHYDSGPAEFQVAEKTLDLGSEINSNLKEMQEVIKTTGIKVPELEKKINEFIEVWYVKYASSQKEAKKLWKEILEMTKEIYKLNFKKGIDVDRFRWAMIFLFAFLGGLIWGVAGRGLDTLDNKFDVYDRISFKKRRNK